MALDKLTVDEKEQLASVLRHAGLKPLLGILDDILERMRDDVLTVPLPNDPQTAAIVLYAKRCHAEGAQMMKSALMGRIFHFKKLMEEGENRS